MNVKNLFKEDRRTYLKCALKGLSFHDVKESTRIELAHIAGKVKFRLARKGITVLEPSLAPFRKKWRTRRYLNILLKKAEKFPFTEDSFKALKSHFPGETEKLTSFAEKVLNGYLSFLGSDEVQFSDGNIPWHTDIKSGYTWDKNLFFLNVPHGHIDGVDVKMPWEMSRLQFLIPLALSYRLTENEKFAEKVISIFQNWCRENPPMQGVNWACTMDVAIRFANFTLAIFLILPSKGVNEDFARLFLKYHLLHANHIYNFLERRLALRSNHYMADICGLLAGCLPFHDIPVYRNKIKFALRELEREVTVQFRKDGGHFESSSYYHGFVTDMVVHTAVLAEKSGFPLSQKAKERLTSGINFLKAVTAPDGLVIQIGDTDSGRFFKFFPGHVRDFYNVIDLGECWLDGKAPTCAESILFFPERGKGHAHSTSHTRGKIKAFSSSGIYVWEDRHAYFVFYNTPHGLNGIGSHNHNDHLSYVLYLNGKEIFTDPGSYLYTPSPQWRNRFRSTAYHNTVTVNNDEQCRFSSLSLFFLMNDAEVTGSIKEGREGIIFEGSHTGYMKRYRIVHTRRITLGTKGQFIQIEDLIESTKKGKADIKVHFHLAPDVELTNKREISAKGVVLSLNAEGIKNWKTSTEWLSPEYGKKVKVHTLDALTTASDTEKIRTLIRWKFRV